MKKVAILGTVGVPASYGGFETLAQNLVDYADKNDVNVDLSVYCSGKNPNVNHYKNARLLYIPIGANGVQSVLYDIVSLFSAVFRRNDVILLLGVSGALILPIIRLISNVKIVTNIDGIEWKRDKWKGIAKYFLRFSEYCAVKFSHDIIADNQGIKDYVKETYDYDCQVISYGGDQAVNIEPKPFSGALPDRFALALCRIEPENNVEMILEAFSKSDFDLVFVGNWSSSEFGSTTKLKYKGFSNITLLDPIYDTGILKTIRSKACVYIHGHSAGGTNPSLVEMMHFGIPIVAYQCNFNGYTTCNDALYFHSSADLLNILNEFDKLEVLKVGLRMKDIAGIHYTWSRIGDRYFSLLCLN
ncbi:DUF1972 domain-containing protein [Shewanella halotolerans]|uniref:DUF1972 domain-containing protein n=1 Tax=Shewanella halotolerans TaxID=2864204 RepID=UPI001C655F1A|nr:DUF1972 domain-containing protein [Shewanella halotolerans]QYJ88696.1 DUF1972 domain-containing protein [Shewanella halotolerans]